MLLFVQNFTFTFSPRGLRQGRRQEQGPLPRAPIPAVRGAASSTGAAVAAQVALPVPPGRDWEVLDACIDADDMRLVGRTYQFLSDRGILANFGKCKNIVLEGPREVTPTVLKEMAVLEAAKLAPKKWSISGNSPYVLVAFLGGVSYLLTQGIDIRPNLAAILALATADAIFLGATCLPQISCFWPPYKRRILVHQAGHLLTELI